MKIDLHTHILPERLPDWAVQFGDPRFVSLSHHEPGRARMMREGKVFREVGENCWSAARRLEDCEAVGVDVQVLSTVPVMFSYWAKPEQALAVSRLLNDHIANLVRQHPRRFVGLGTLPMQDTKLATKELERCMRELHLSGVQIGTHVNGLNLDEPALVDVLSAAQDLGAAVFVHPWDMLGGERMRRYFLPWLVGMPTETSLAICSLIFGGVLDKLPKLRIGFAHGGGAFFGTLGRIEQGFLTRPDLCAVNTQHGPRHYLGRFYVDSLVHDADFLRSIVKLNGASRVGVGSDYPFPLGEERPGALVESMKDLDANARNRLRSGTALEFLALSASRFSA